MLSAPDDYPSKEEQDVNSREEDAKEGEDYERQRSIKCQARTHEIIIKHPRMTLSFFLLTWGLLQVSTPKKWIGRQTFDFSPC